MPRLDRLRTLANHLMSIKPYRFTLDQWSNENVFKVLGIPILPCGFAGCAMGWAAHDKLFEGLYLDGNMIKYKNFSSFTAAAELFEIPHRAADWLFCACEYDREPTPMDVAMRIHLYANKLEADGDVEKVTDQLAGEDALA